MHIYRTHPVRARLADEARRLVPEKQIQRWLDDGGTDAPWAPQPRETPVMWSPPALCARLDAEAALRAQRDRRSAAVRAARREVARIVSAVDARRLDQAEAMRRLRDLAARFGVHEGRVAS